jgi:hypothetical protein
MRRWLAILMLAFLPIQFSWAAVASYCAYDAGTGASHPGHHEHERHGHATQDADPGGEGLAGDTGSGTAHADCDHCHGYCAGMVEGMVRLDPPALASALPGRGQRAFTEPLPAQPERPQWASLA